MSDQITITHTPDEGTLATGDTRPYAALLKARRWRWSRNITAWFIPNSRDRRPDTWRIDMTRQALEEAGVTVTVDLDDSMTPTAEREANKAERLEERRTALAAKATRLDEASTAAYNRSHELAQLIPLGQPILVGHHSERGHRAHLDKIHRAMDKSCELQHEATETARRVVGSERTERHRYTAPATIRRIEKLEAEHRDLARKIERATKEGNTAWRDRLVLLDEENLDALTYWRGHLAQLQADGVKVWSAADFQVGDYVRYWHGSTSKVLRVNKKSLTIETPYSWTNTLPYDQVRGKIAAADMAESAAD